MIRDGHTLLRVCTVALRPGTAMRLYIVLYFVLFSSIETGFFLFRPIVGDHRDHRQGSRENEPSLQGEIIIRGGNFGPKKGFPGRRSFSADIFLFFFSHPPSLRNNPTNLQPHHLHICFSFRWTDHLYSRLGHWGIQSAAIMLPSNSIGTILDCSSKYCLSSFLSPPETLLVSFRTLHIVCFLGVRKICKKLLASTLARSSS